MPKSLPSAIHSLADLFEFSCRQKPQERAYAFVRDTLELESQLTYGELDHRVRSLAGYLARRARPGTRVLLLYPPGLDAVCAFWACMCAGLVAVPAPAPDPVRRKHSLPRLRAIIDDAQVSLALTISGIEIISLELSIAKNGSHIEWIATDQPYDESGAAELPRLNETDLAYLQYTSGSTTTPRGVMVSHGNVLSHCKGLSLAAGVSDRSRSLCWLPYFHDYGLLHGIIAPFYAGIPAYLMSPVTFLRRPLRWLEAVSRFAITHSGGPNFSYESCLRAVRHQREWQADLSTWMVASCGAEPISPDTVEQFIEIFGPQGFRRTSFAPAYGLAEATLLVTMKRAEVEPRLLKVEAGALADSIVKESSAPERGVRTLVGCGEPLEETRVQIVNPTTKSVCPPGVVGEVWLAGPGIASGYWGRQEESHATFNATLAGSGEGPYLRTGDLGFIHEEELFLTGRLKDLIIVRGRNYYPYDLEWAAEQAHSGLRRGCGAAFSIASETGERVVLVYELEKKLPEAEMTEVMSSIRRTLADEYELEVHNVVLIKSGTIPRTSSGKIQRYACKADFESGRLAVIGASTLGIADEGAAVKSLSETPPTAVEKKLSDIWQEVLGGPQPRRHDNFFERGGHSLLATQLVSRIREVFKVDVSLRVAFERPTIAALAEEVTRLRREDQTASAFPPIVRVSRNQPLPLSYSQQRMWLMYRLAPEGTAYNMLCALRLMGPLNKSALRRTIDAICGGHEAFRTTFSMSGEGPIQIVNSFHPPHWVEVDLFSLLPEEQRWQEAVRLVEQEANWPFDLEKGPLARFLLIETGVEDHVLALTMHHIIGDQWSFGVIGREVAWFYNAFCRGETSPAKPMSLQYADYAVWQRRCLSDEWLSTQSDYWQKQLAGLSKLSLPTDYPRPAMQTFNGSQCTLELSASSIERLKLFSAEHHATVFMTLLACFQILLSRYSDQSDIAVGSPIANRTQSAVESIVGSFVNTLVLRTDLSGNPTFAELLARVRATALGAYANQDFPFDKLVEMVHSHRDHSSAPLVQVLFNLGNAPIGEIDIHGLSWAPFEVNTRAAQFDLSLTVETEIFRKAYLTFNTDLFARQTAERMLGQYNALLHSALNNPAAKLSDLSMHTAPDRIQMLQAWNRTQADYPQAECFSQMFEEQAERTPDTVALSMGQDTLRYRELNAQANRLAHYLRTLDVRPGAVVGICLERSLEMVVALMAVLKAGGAYVPLDPEYPRDRLRFMAEDAAAAIVLTSESLSDRFDARTCRTLCLDQEQKKIAREADHNLQPTATSQDLAYILYTSGSTGQPKGVEIPHRALVNFLCSMRKEPGCSAHDVMVSVTTLSFDIAGLELYVPLLVGARVEIVSRAVAMDGRKLRALCEAVQPTIMQATPATWRMLIEAGWPGSNRLTILCGGEALPPDLAGALLDRSATLWNMYGPTETTIWSTIEKIQRSDLEISIGRPIANTETYILDQFLQPVPIGVSGELYIGGHGIARGYCRRPDLTKERFVPHPFSTELHAKLYRTGDVARYRSDGRIVHLGRVDHQVKIRGFRVELGEIETVLSRHLAVSQVVVTAREDQQGFKQLAAYLVCKESPAPSSTELRAFVRTALPEYMTPSFFVFLEAMPLTANNKVDRRALPAPAPAPADRSVHIGPRDQLEVQLAALWQQVLEVPEIGIHDNFFDLGGQSLKAAQLFFLLEQVYGRHLPLATLFQAPTIAELASILSREQWTPPWQSLVAIQPSGAASPIFAVPGVGGNVLVFAKLAQLLGKDQPFYGLQTRGLDGREAPFTSVVEMAAHYVDEIRSMQPQGPYIIAGTCTGAVIAYEMAQQLTARQERVILIVIESWHPLSYNGFVLRTKRYVRPLLYVWKRMSQFLAGSRQMSVGARLRLGLGKLHERIERIGIDADGKIFGETFTNQRVAEATLEAIAFYKTQEFKGTLLNITASDRVVAGSVVDTRKVWEVLTRGEVTSVSIPAANSGQLFVSPHVEALFGHLDAFLPVTNAQGEIDRSCRTPM